MCKLDCQVRIVNITTQYRDLLSELCRYMINENHAEKRKHVNEQEVQMMLENRSRQCNERIRHPKKVIATRIASTTHLPSSAPSRGGGPRSTAPFGFSTVWRGNVDVRHWGSTPAKEDARVKTANVWYGFILMMKGARDSGWVGHSRSGQGRRG